mmetsp:Transcript_81653/g.214336  ORF Transcript_81653/g.214336 Transcript_81653/m.214336 type:complete len:246 (+) Transcript_81653:378-1115(+)
MPLAQLVLVRGDVLGQSVPPPAAADVGAVGPPGRPIPGGPGVQPVPLRRLQPHVGVLHRAHADAAHEAVLELPAGRAAALAHVAGRDGALQEVEARLPGDVAHRAVHGAEARRDGPQRREVVRVAGVGLLREERPRGLRRAVVAPHDDGGRRRGHVGVEVRELAQLLVLLDSVDGTELRAARQVQVALGRHPAASRALRQRPKERVRPKVRVRRAQAHRGEEAAAQHPNRGAAPAAARRQSRPAD